MLIRSVWQVLSIGPKDCLIEMVEFVIHLIKVQIWFKYAELRGTRESISCREILSCAKAQS